MPGWTERPREEANLFNPAFCGALTFEFVSEFHKAKKNGPSFVLIFCALPAALHLRTRKLLPGSVRASLYSWIEQNADQLIGFPKKAAQFVPYAQEGIRFSLDHNVINLVRHGELEPGALPASFGRRMPPQVTPEIDEIVHSVRLLARWFAAAGSPSSILSAWGLRL